MSLNQIARLTSMGPEPTTEKHLLAREWRRSEIRRLMAPVDPASQVASRAPQASPRSLAHPAMMPPWSRTAINALINGGHILGQK